MGSFGTPSAPGGFGGGGSPYGFDGGNPVGDDEDNTDYTSERQIYALGLHPVGNGLMTVALFAANGNPIEATRQFLSGRGALGNKLSAGERGMAAVNAAAAVAGPLLKAAEEVPAVARGINKAREAHEAAEAANARNFGGLRRPRPTIPDGNLKGGWKHIDARHVTGDHPNGPGALFPPGTTRAQLEAAARELAAKGTRQTEPGIAKQTYTGRLTVNGRRGLVKVVIGPDGKVISIFPWTEDL